MQVPPIPPPIVANALPQDVAAKAAPTAQAVAPLMKNAVDPTHKDETFKNVERNKEKPKKDRNKNRSQREENDKEGDHSVNIRI